MYKALPFDKQDRIKEGLIRIVGDGYLPIQKIMLLRIAGGADSFLPLEEQDRLNMGLLKFRDKIAEKNIRLGKEYRYRDISGLVFEKIHPFVRIRHFKN